MSDRLTAAEAARLTQTTEQEHAAENAESIRAVLPVVYAAVRAAATAQVPTYAAEVDLAEHGLTPPQQLTLTTELKREGFAVQLKGSVLVVGWHPVPTRRVSSAALGTFPLPHGVNLRE